MKEIERIYVDMAVLNRKDGTQIPLAVYWEGRDGIRNKYMIEKVMGRSSLVVSETGAMCVKYRICIGGRNCILFQEKGRGKWFMERVKS